MYVISWLKRVCTPYKCMVLAWTHVRQKVLKEDEAESERGK